MHSLGKTPARSTFYEAEAKAFAGYSLTPRIRVLSLDKPALQVRVLEVGSGGPTGVRARSDVGRCKHHVHPARRSDCA